MNSKFSCLVLCALLVTTSVHAINTFVTEPVSMNEAETIEIGVAPSYRVDEFTLEGVPDVDYTDTFMRVDVSGRWVPRERWEFLLGVPYVSDKTESEGGGTSISDNDSGLGQVILGGKYSFHPMLGVAARIELPTAEQSKELGEGTNYGISLLGERAIGLVTFMGNVGYMFKSKYDTTFDVSGAPESEVDAGDLIQLNLAALHSRWNIDWVGEVNVNLIGEQEVDGVSNSESDGTSADLLVGGSKILAEDWRVKGALAFGIGDEVFRSFDQTRGAGDYRILLAGEYKFRLGR